MTSNAEDFDTGGSDVEPQMAVAGGPFGFFKQPIHESLTLSALISSGSDIGQGTTVRNANPHDWEYLRGVVWNDDPDCQLFNDSAGENHTYSTGFQWAYYFKHGASEWNPNDLDPGRMKNPIGRSHFGDLQFLHCMASISGEDAHVTKEKVMAWMEVMYKLANDEDGITPDTKVQQTKLRQLFPNDSLPPRWMSLTYLLAKDSKFQGLDIRRRALGSMFHVIQDSYAIGHTKRTLLNKGDMQSTDPLRVRQGATDRWGAIGNFHTYGGQNSDEHSHYDHGSDEIPDPGNLGNLDQWNGLIGCRDAVDKCRGLAILRHAGRRWDGGGGVKDYLNREVFALSGSVTPANNHVLS